MKEVRRSMSDLKNISNPFGVEGEKDELAEEATYALKYLNTLEPGNEIKTGEVLANYLILIRFLLKQNQKRNEEYRLLLTSINELKDDIKSAKEQSNGVYKSKYKKSLFGWLSRQKDGKTTVQKRRGLD